MEGTQTRKASWVSPGLIKHSRVAMEMESSEEEKNIYVEVINKIALRVKMSETIKNLKSIVREKEGYAENLQELFFADEWLRDDLKLADYGVHSNSTLHLVIHGLDLIKIFINIPSYEKILELEVETCHTIENIKSLIQEREGTQSNCYSLLYRGKLLEDDRTLASLDIPPQSILYLVFHPRDVILISVKMPNGEIVKSEVKALFTIHDVKLIIGSMVGFSVAGHNLLHAGKKLADSKTLACYDIGENHVLEISTPTFQIFVKDWHGKTIILDVREDETIWCLKHKVFDKLHVPVEVQSLKFARKLLKDDLDLASYNIQKDSTLHLVFRSSTVHWMKFSEIGPQVLALRKTTPIFYLKATIQKIMGRRVKKVLIDGLELENGLTMAAYGIDKDTMLMLVLEVR